MSDNPIARPRNLAALDGGGIRGVVQLLILDHIMATIRTEYKLKSVPRPCEYFDLIGGTSTGGLNALLLGRLKMSTEEALRIYPGFAKNVFGTPKSDAGKVKLGGYTRYSAKTMEKEIKMLVVGSLTREKHPELEDETMLDTLTRENLHELEDEPMLDTRVDACKTFVLAVTSKHTNARAGPRRIATYHPSVGRHFEAKIWEAARATSAAPRILKPISIGPQDFAEEFIDGGLGYNNPVFQVLEEAEMQFPNDHIACVLSIGTGVAKPARYDAAWIPSDIINTLVEISTNCETIEKSCADKFKKIPGFYFRFNLHGLEDVGLDDWRVLGDVKTLTMNYLQDVKDEVRAVAKILHTRPSCLPASSLNAGLDPQSGCMSQSISARLEPKTSCELDLPPIHLLVGRETELDLIVNAFTCEDRARIAILGPPGIGKTTLAAAVLHHGEVKARYPQERYFVECDTIKSVDPLLLQMAKALRIPLQGRDQYLRNIIFFFLQSNHVLLCLDNLETPWETDRGGVEKLLIQLANMQQLALLITMRGIQRPAADKAIWKPLLPPLQPFKPSDAAKLFKEISGKEDEFTVKLINDVEFVPLAVSLLATRAQDSENDSTETLWKLWESHRTSIVENGGDDRVSSLDVSIQLSIESQRIRRCPTAIQILALLAILPDGLNTTESMLHRLKAYIPDIDLRKALDTLTRTALAFEQGSADSRRIQLLSTIRHYTLTNIEPKWRDSIMRFYLDIAEEGKNYSETASWALVRSELRNIRSILVDAMERGIPDERIFQAAIIYTDWLGYLGSPDDGVIRLALDVQAPSQSVHGSCMACSGRVYLHISKVDEAEKTFTCALELHRQAKDVLGEANDHQNLGEVYMRRDELDEAEKTFKCALELHRQVKDVLGEANDHRNLGEVYLRRHELDEAEMTFKCALELHRQAKSVLGEANVCLNLGEVYMRRDELDEAEMTFKCALELHRQAKSVRGEANDHQNLGEVYMRRGELDDAEKTFTCALELHRQAKDVLGEAHVSRNLGKVYMRRGELDEAEKTFTCALELHLQAKDVLGEANDLRNLGEVYMRRDELDEAEKTFKCTLELHRQVKDVLGEANDHRNLGEVYLRRHELDEAEMTFKCALELHRQAKSVLGEANVCLNLGEVYMRRDELDEAEMTFKCALELHRQVKDVLGEANVCLNLGEVYMRRDELDEAEMTFKCALELHRQVKGVLGEANVCLNLGEIYMWRRELDEAEMTFKCALELHRQAKSVLGEANDHRNLGEVYMRRDELDEAEMTFKCALELHRQAKDVLGEANDHQNLGQVYMRRDELDEAEMTFKCALELHRQAKSVLGEANDHRNLGEIYMRRRELDEAEMTFKCALELHRQVKDVLGEANDHHNLGEVYMRRGELDEAEKRFTCALELHRRAKSVLGEANVCLNLGEVYMRRGELDEAEKTFTCALKLHRQVKSVLGEANDHRYLGQVYMQRDELDKAETTFKCALELHRWVKDVLGEANDHGNLGQLYIQRKELDEAERTLKSALELHRQAKDVLGEADDFLNLARVYVLREKLDDAEMAFECALELHRRTNSVCAEFDLKMLRAIRGLVHV